jgi:hypothetical protein
MGYGAKLGYTVYEFSGPIMHEDEHTVTIDNEDGSGTVYSKALMWGVHRTPWGRITFKARANCAIGRVGNAYAEE